MPDTSKDKGTKSKPSQPQPTSSTSGHKSTTTAKSDERSSAAVRTHSYLDDDEVVLGVGEEGQGPLPPKRNDGRPATSTTTTTTTTTTASKSSTAATATSKGEIEAKEAGRKRPRVAADEIATTHNDDGEGAAAKSKDVDKIGKKPAAAAAKATAAATSTTPVPAPKAASKKNKDDKSEAGGGSDSAVGASGTESRVGTKGSGGSRDRAREKETETETEKNEKAGSGPAGDGKVLNAAESGGAAGEKANVSGGDGDGEGSKTHKKKKKDEGHSAGHKKHRTKDKHTEHKKKDGSAKKKGKGKEKSGHKKKDAEHKKKHREDDSSATAKGKVTAKTEGEESSVCDRHQNSAALSGTDITNKESQRDTSDANRGETNTSHDEPCVTTSKRRRTSTDSAVASTSSVTTSAENPQEISETIAEQAKAILKMGLRARRMSSTKLAAAAAVAVQQLSQSLVGDSASQSCSFAPDGDAVSQLVKLVMAAGQSDLVLMLRYTLSYKNGEDTPQFLRAVFTGCTSWDAESLPITLTMKSTIIKSSLKMLDQGLLTGPIVTRCMAVISNELDNLPAETLVNIVEHIVSSVEADFGKFDVSVDLLPKSLALISTADKITPQPENEFPDTSPMKFKEQIIGHICEMKWPTRSTLKLCQVMRDINLSTNEVKVIVKKIISLLSGVDIQNSINIVHQLLLLSSKGQRAFILKEISRYFSSLDTSDKPNSSLTTTLEVEGVILHALFCAAQQDHELAHEFMKEMKNRPACLTPFCLAMLLSLSRLRYLQEEVMDLLKSLFTVSIDSSIKRPSFLSSAIVSAEPQNHIEMREVLQQTVKNSLRGWGMIASSLIQLGFYLMDHPPSKLKSKTLMESSITSHQPPSLASSAHTQRSNCGNMCGASALGFELLTQAFYANDESMQDEIVEQAINRIVECCATTPSYIEFLSALIAEKPGNLLRLGSKVKQMLDYLFYLPPPVASAIVNALQPLLRVSPPLLDATVIVLKKALFSKQTEAREIGVQGFLAILRNAVTSWVQPLPGSASQARLQKDRSKLMEPLTLEILGFLRRSLTQQAPVKSCLYKGVSDLTCVSPFLCASVFDLLLPHLDHFLNPDADTFPIKLTACIKDGEIGEPLHKLLSCLTRCIYYCTNSSASNKDLGVLTKPVADHMKLLTRRLLASDISESVLFGAIEDLPSRQHFVDILLGIHEALMDFFFTCETPFTGDAIDAASRLYDNHIRVSAYGHPTKAKGKKVDDPSEASKDTEPKKSKVAIKGTKSKKPTATPDEPSAAVLPTKPSTPIKHTEREVLLSMQSIDFLLSFINSTESDAHLKSILLNNSCLIQFFFETCLQKLNTTFAPNSYSASQFSEITPIALKMMQRLGKEYANDHKKLDRGKALSLLEIECYEKVTQLVCHENSIAVLSDFLDKTFSQIASSVSPLTHVDTCLEQFESLAESFFGEPSSSDEAAVALRIMSMVVDFLPKELWPRHAKWILQQCTSVQVKKKDLAMEMARLYMKLGSAADMQPAMRLATELCSFFGDPIDAPKMSFVNADTSNAILDEVIPYIQNNISLIKWGLERLKLSKLNLGDDADPATLKQLRHAVDPIFILMSDTIGVLSCLVPFNIEGSREYALVKVLIKMYTVLSIATKEELETLKAKGDKTKKSSKNAKFKHFVKQSATLLIPETHKLIDRLARAEKSKKATVTHDAKHLPQLVFAMETYETAILKLDAKHKLDYFNHFKRYQARDFKIDRLLLKSHLTELDNKAASSTDAAPVEPKKKRPRKS
ncbi:Fanconi anemia group I protein [Pelomyxa schiedti]|nr:Fanconi anemia group I protein [Pelomyxa schiedti]